MSISHGLRAESFVKAYLIEQGLMFVAQNFRSKSGEIDLIMKDKDTLVFVEVRARTSPLYGDALSSVTYFKRRKLVKTATYYLLQQGLHDRLATRFDVVALDGFQPRMTWIKNAFDLDG